jgi:hypothetical protein
MFLRKSNNFVKKENSNMLSLDHINSTQVSRVSNNESRVLIFQEPPLSLLSKSINFEGIKSLDTFENPDLGYQQQAFGNNFEQHPHALGNHHNH